MPDVPIIRPYRESDVAPLFEAARESIDHVYPWLPWCHPDYSIADSQAWVERALREWSARSAYYFAIEDAAGRFLGGCGLNELREDASASIGYWVRASSLGKAVAPRAVARLIEFAFAQTQLQRLEILVALENRASARVAEKVGARFEGIAKGRILMHGKAYDARLYAVLRRDGAAARTEDGHA